jgi:hypothetical protein
VPEKEEGRRSDLPPSTPPLLANGGLRNEPVARELTGDSPTSRNAWRDPSYSYGLPDPP